MSNIIYADIEIAKKVVREKYPNAKHIEFIEHGYDNLVCLIDNMYAIKFPRYNHAHTRALYEKIILEDLSEVDSITIPKVIGSNENPPYLITTFVQGESINDEEINNFSDEDQNSFAKKIAEFAYKIHSLISVDKTIRDQKEIGMNDFNYYDYALNDFTFPTPEQDRIVKKYYHSWKTMKYGGPKVVNHNDLNTMNLLFEDKKLVGIIDFGDAQIGYPEQELRQLYRISERIMERTASYYEELSEQKLSRDAIKVNAIIQEMAAYAGRLKDNNITHPGFIRAKNHLEQWFPKCNWNPK